MINCDVCLSERPSIKSLRRHLLREHGCLFDSRRGRSLPYPGSEQELRRAQERQYQDQRIPASSRQMIDFYQR